MGDVQRSPSQFLRFLLAHQLSHLSIERFSVCKCILGEVQSPMAVRANGHGIRNSVRSVIRELAEMMNFQKRKIVCSEKRSGLVASLACPVRTFKYPSFDLEIPNEAASC
ncbi:hypothetical protein WJ21_06885 [Burkholderia vietnamiensis]|nr:hypothetical protein WJ21_06885 [Burkholderia vietnamiensis]